MLFGYEPKPAPKPIIEKQIVKELTAEEKKIIEDKKIEDQKIADQKARETLISKQFSAWNGEHIKLTRIIKDSMNDPDSFEHIESKYWDEGDHLIIIESFRGKNAFWGIVKNSVKAKVSIDGNDIQVVE